MVKIVQYKTLLFDVDDTLLDFKKGERYALSEIFSTYGITPYERGYATYQAINSSLWRAAEEGEITVDEIFLVRFVRFLEDLHIQDDGVKLDERFRNYVAEKDFSFDGCYDLLARLAPHYELAIVTNGHKTMQEPRLKKAHLYDFFSHIFISADIGVQKPDIRFFEAVEQGMPNLQHETTLIIGDSLTSDMEGGRRFGIATCWYNPNHLPLPKEPVDYIIANYNELEQLLLWQDEMRIAIAQDNSTECLYFVGELQELPKLAVDFNEAVAEIKALGFLPTTKQICDYTITLQEQVRI